MEKQILKFYKEHPDARIPERMRDGDAGMDLTSVETKTIKAGERELIEIGLRIICPYGYYYTYAPRSSMAFKYNVVPSHFNIMDSNYTGNTGVLMHNRSNKDYVVEKGDRIAQLIIQKVIPVENIEISKEEFESIITNRGKNGFGSSGK